MQKFTINILLIFVAIGVSTITMEIIARMLVGVPSPYPMPYEIEAFDKRGFRTMRPGFNGVMDNRIDFVNRSVTIGSNGERLSPCTNSTADKTYKHRIFLLGDSQTFGFGLSNEETWAHRMNCELNNLLKQNVAVFNLGVPGTNIHHYWLRGLKQLVPQLRSDDIVFVSITWNDLIDFYKGEEWLDRVLAKSGLKRRNQHLQVIDNKLDIFDAPQGRGTGLDIILDRDLNPIKSWRQKFYELTGLLVPDFGSLAAFTTSMTYTSALFRLIASPLKMLYYRLRGRAPMGSIKSTTKPRFNAMTLVALKRVINMAGARMSVQILPNRLFFDDYYYQAYSQNGLGFPEQDYSGHVMLPLCEIYKLDCLNRFNALKTSERDSHAFAFDGHFNPVGAHKIGKALARDLFARLEP